MARSANLPRMQSKASMTWENGPRAHWTLSAPTRATSQVAAAPTPCESQQQQQEEEPVGPSLNRSPQASRQLTAASSIHGGWNAPAPHRVVALPKTPVVQSHYFSAALMAGLPRSQQGSIETIIPEGWETESLNTLPPVTMCMAGDIWPKEDHNSLPGLHRARPVTSSKDAHTSAHALALAQKSVGDVRGSPRSKGGSKVLDLQVQHQGRKLNHVECLTFDMASTVKELVGMQRKLCHELQEVKLLTAKTQQKFRSSYADLRSLQRSGVQPPPLASPPPYRSHYDAQFPVHWPTDSMPRIGSGQLENSWVEHTLDLVLGPWLQQC